MQINLLNGHWTSEQIAEVLRAVPRRPLLPPLDAPEWRRAAAIPSLAAFAAPLRARAYEECGLPLPPLTPELYAITSRTGSRKEFETVYFARRQMMGRAVVALLLSEPQSLERATLERSVIAKVEDLMAEPAWALPAHVRPPTGIDPMRIDLFGAETANLMAELIDLFGAVLPGELIARIRQRLQREFFDNYRKHHREFEWTTAGMNWNAVCHQGVIGAALSQMEDARELAEMLVLVGGFLPHFLRGFTPDGGSSEGPGYWSYGFGWFIALNEQLETRTAGRLSLLEGDDHVRAIARFGPLTQLPHQKFVNFSDGGAEGILRPSTLLYLGERLRDPLATGLGRANYQYLARTGLDLDGQRSDTFYLTRLALRWPATLDVNAPEPKPEDSFFSDLGVMVAHGRDACGHQWDFAAKGGHNHEHHNHNDCGSYLVNIDGRRMIEEIGAPEYVIDFFGPRCYEFLAARTLGHSLPVINGAEQAAGEAFHSRITRHVLADDRAELEVDLTACYPPEAFCSSYIRTFVFHKTAGRLTVTDAFVLEKTVSLESAVITSHSVLQEPARAVISDGTLKLVLRPAPGTVLARVEKHTYLMHITARDASVHRLVWAPAALTREVKLEYTIELA